MGVDLGQVLTIGGPISAFTAILVVLVNAYLSSRKDNREQQESEVKTDGAIVDNAKKVLELVRGETDRMEQRIVRTEEENGQLRDKNRQLEAHIAKQDRRLAAQDRLIEDLREDLEELKTSRGARDHGGAPAA